MSHKIRYRFLTLHARLLRNILATIGVAGFLAACSGGTKTDQKVNQDSINQVNEKARLDSIATVRNDSIAKVKADSLAKVREDSIKKAQIQQPITKYGVPINNDIVKPKYGPPYEHDVPVTRYGAPVDFIDG